MKMEETMRDKKEAIKKRGERLVGSDKQNINITAP